jgi:hypothetical protein
MRLKGFKRRSRRFFKYANRKYPFLRLAFFKQFYKYTMRAVKYKLLYIKKRRLRKINIYLAAAFLKKRRSVNSKFLIKKKKKFFNRKIVNFSTRFFFFKRYHIHHLIPWSHTTKFAQLRVFKKQFSVTPFYRMKFFHSTFDKFSRYLHPIFFSRTKLTFQLSRFGFLFISDEFLHKLGINEITFVRKKFILVFI